MFEDNEFNENLNNNENMMPEENKNNEVPFEESLNQASDQATDTAEMAEAGQAAAESRIPEVQQAEPNGQAAAGNQAPEAGQISYGNFMSGSGTSGTYGNSHLNMTTEPEESEKNKRLAKHVGVIVAAALLFGVVAGLTMFGINSLADRVSGRSAAVAQVERGSSHEDVSVSHAETASIPAVSAVAVDVSDIVENAMPSIVAIDNTMIIQQQTWFGRSQEYQASASGSGIIVGQSDDELLIATNNHVVESSKDITVTFIDDTQVPAAVKGTDSDMDLAVIAVSLSDIDPETLSQIKVATIGNSDDLRVGEGVIAIGNALGYGQSVTVGVISALDREVETDDAVTRNLLQTDAAINPGNSGGALLNMRGELIGINSAKYSGTAVEGMGYAIPISAAEDILNELMNKHTRVEVAEARQGYLGIQGTNIDETAATMYDMPRGVYVFKILDGGAAASSDLHEKDIITKFDGQTVKTMAELKEMLTYYEAGSTIDLTVQRLENGEYVERTVTITLGLKDLEES